MELSQITRQRKNNRMSETRAGVLDEPMGYVEGANLYEFVAGDPYGASRPTGREGRTCDPSNFGADNSTKPRVERFSRKGTRQS